jgi:PglZ domain
LAKVLSRVKYFQSTTAGRSVVLKLNELMKPSKKRQQEIIAADVVLVTSQEIDRRGEETEDEEEARRFMDEVLEKLRRGIRRLASLGVRHVVLAADHGHLFVEEPDEAMKIDPPGGQTVDLHPRVWIGRGGTAAPGYMRVTASQLGLAGDLELAFPLSLACFRTRGSSRGYCHGGISLQELVLPVASITVHESRAADVGTATVMLSVTNLKSPRGSSLLRRAT